MLDDIDSDGRILAVQVPLGASCAMAREGARLRAAVMRIRECKGDT